MFEIVDRAPLGSMWTRYWDLAVGEHDKDSFTASLRCAVDNGYRYFDAMIRIRKEWPDIRKLIKETSLREDRELNGHVLIGIESQGPQKGMIQECYADTELSNIGIIPIPVSQSKRIRALPLAAAGESGKIRLVKGAWNEPFIQEMCEFDTGDHDDQVDAASGSNKMQSLLGGMGITDLNESYAEAGAQDDTTVYDEQVLSDEKSEFANEETDFFYAGVS
jgi:predicted phage terminase large subunit-like protein